jgi:hypothetical protein
VDNGIPFHLVLDLAQIEPVRRPDPCRGELTLANRPPDGIRTHANEGREFLNRKILCLHMLSLVQRLVPPYAEGAVLGIRQETAYDCL